MLRQVVSDVLEDRTPSIIGAMVPLKRWPVSVKLHDATSQKADTFMLVAVRIWNPTCIMSNEQWIGKYVEGSGRGLL
jgi:hypothetical protein